MIETREFSVFFLGAILGLRHAFEPDHLAAVSTLINQQRGMRRSAALGAVWGLGHTAALLVVVGLLTLAGSAMPPQAATGFELLVAATLVTLGVRSIVRAVRDGRRGPLGVHRHGAVEHAHPLPSEGHLHLGRWTFARRSLLVGLIHGLAGSGSMTALAAAKLPSTAGRLIYVGLFGLGSVAGMALMSGIAGWPIARLYRHPATGRLLGVTTGAFAVAVGVVWAIPLLLSS